MARRVFHLIPHTHWDREWYLPRAAFQVRLVTMLDGLIPRLEADRALRFTLDGQTVLLEDYFEVRPGMRPRVARLVRAGQLAVGPWYVLADELIPSAESLRRNLMLGLADARTLGGAMPVLYSPDAFGHPEWLPDLAGECGLRWGVIWRGLAGDRDRGPDLYQWWGPGGGSILVHHLPPEGYEVGAHLPGLKARDLGPAWRRLRDRLVTRSLTRHVAVPIGADHHAPHPRLETLLDRLRRIDREATYRWSRWEDYFRGVERTRVWTRPIRGELRDGQGYAWNLQGVHGSRCRLKRLHGEAEWWLTRIADPLLQLGRRDAGRSADQTALQRTWRTLVQSQFHDTLAGTVCDEAAREQEARLESVIATCREAVRDRLWRLARHDPDRARERRPHGGAVLLCWNPGPGVWRGVVTAAVPFFRRDQPVGPPGNVSVRRAAGPEPFQLRRGRRPVAVQVLGASRGVDRQDARHHYPDLDLVDRVSVAFDPGPIAAGGLARLEVVRGAAATPGPPSPVRAGGRWLDNGLIRVSVTRAGLVALTDRRTGERYRGLFRLIDEPDAGDLYTPWIDPRRPVRQAEVTSVSVMARGPLVGRLELRWRLRSAGRGRLSGVTLLDLAAGNRWVHCAVDLVNQARDHRLRLIISPRLPGPALAGTAQGVVRRAPGETIPGPGEWKLGTAPAHEFVAAGAGRRGLMVRQRGSFEYQLDRAGRLCLTLLRSVGQLSRDRLAPRPGHAAWPVATPGAEEPGMHRVDLLIAPFPIGRGLRRGHLPRLPSELVSEILR